MDFPKSDYDPGLRGTIRIAANTSAITQFLPVDLARFIEDHPNMGVYFFVNRYKYALSGHNGSRFREKRSSRYCHLTVLGDRIGLLPLSCIKSTKNSAASRAYRKIIR